MRKRCQLINVDVDVEDYLLEDCKCRANLFFSDPMKTSERLIRWQ